MADAVNSVTSMNANSDIFDFNKNLGKALKEQRLLAGMTVRELSEILSISPSQVYKFEMGVNHVNAISLWRYAEAFKISLADLCDKIDSLTINGE